MNDYKAKALERLNEKIDKLSPHGNAVKEHVLRVLKDFCEQNSEFAQAIAQSGKTVKDCIESTVNNCGSSISDIEVYRRAVAFWFEGATVNFKMTLDLGDGGFSNEGSGEEDAPSKPKRLEMSLDDLF